MKKLAITTVCGLVLAASTAFAQDVRYNFDKDTNFGKFTTYRWVAIKDATPPDGNTDKQIKSAGDAQLTQKGLTKVDSDPADLYIGYQAAIGQEKQFPSFSSGWGYGPGWYGGGWYGHPGAGMTTGETSTIYTGQLAVDMYDSTSHTLVWRGVASKS